MVVSALRHSIQATLMDRRRDARGARSRRVHRIGGGGTILQCLMTQWRNQKPPLPPLGPIHFYPVIRPSCISGIILGRGCYERISEINWMEGFYIIRHTLQISIRQKNRIISACALNFREVALLYLTWRRLLLLKGRKTDLAAVLIYAPFTSYCVTICKGSRSQVQMALKAQY